MVVNLLDLDAPPLPVMKCLGGCGKKLWDPESRKRGYGPDCAERLGLIGPASPRISRRDGGDCPGQGDLLQEAGDTSGPGEAQSPLRWHYGDDARMWCYDCGGEVWGFEEGRICDGCGRSEDPEGSDTPEEDQ